MTEDEELAEIRKRKMERLLRMTQEPKKTAVDESLAKGFVAPLTDMDFWQIIQQTRNAAVDFYGEWCNPCKALAPIFAELAREYVGKVFFGRIDVDKNPRTAGQFGVQSVPMIVFFKNGKPVANLPGLRSYADYEMTIERLLKA